MKRWQLNYYSVPVLVRDRACIVNAYEVSVFDPKSDTEKVEFHPNCELHNLVNKSVRAQIL